LRLQKSTVSLTARLPTEDEKKTADPTPGPKCFKERGRQRRYSRDGSMRADHGFADEFATSHYPTVLNR
jgi:hypothetical protein